MLTDSNPTNAGTVDFADIRDMSVLERTLRQRVADRGRFASLRLVQRICVRHYSLLYRGITERDGAQFAVKVSIDPSGKPDAGGALRQFEAMERVYRAMPPAGMFTVPSPHFVMPELGLVVLDWIDGENVTRKVLSLRTPRADSTALARRCGEWLRAFHDAGPRPPRRIDVHEKLRRAMRSDAPHALHTPAMEPWFSALRETADAVMATDLRASWLHGDFKSDNLMVAGERLYGIDIQLAHENASVHDLASFLNHLALSMFHPRGWRQAIASRQIEAAFLDGYGGPLDAGERRALAWLRLAGLVALRDEYRSHGRSTLAKALHDHALHRLANALRRELRAG